MDKFPSFFSKFWLPSAICQIAMQPITEIYVTGHTPRNIYSITYFTPAGERAQKHIQTWVLTYSTTVINFTKALNNLAENLERWSILEACLRCRRLLLIWMTFKLPPLPITRPSSNKTSCNTSPATPGRHQHHLHMLASHQLLYLEHVATTNQVQPTTSIWRHRESWPLQVQYVATPPCRHHQPLAPVCVTNANDINVLRCHVATTTSTTTTDHLNVITSQHHLWRNHFDASPHHYQASSTSTTAN